MAIIEIKVLQHVKTGLLMAVSESVPGFTIYAHSDEEMREKLIPAYKAYMEGIGEPVSGECELVNKSTPGFFPPAFVIQAGRKAAA